MKPTSLLKSGLWITLAAFITRISAFLSSLILVRFLQPSDFGVIGIAYVFWSFFTLFTQDSAGTFIVYKGADDPRYVNTAYTVSLSIGLVFGLGMVATAPLAAGFFNQPALTGILVAFAFNLLLASASGVHGSVLTRRMQYRTITGISVIGSVTRLLCTISSAMFGMSYWSFVIGDTASGIVNCVLTRYYSRHAFRLQLDREVRSEVISFCLSAAGSSIGLYSIFNLDNFAVGKLLGSTSLGYYSLAYQLTSAVPTVFSPVLNQLGVPVFAQLTDEQQQEDALFNVVQQVSLLTAPICVLIFLLLNPQVVTVLFGAKWIPLCTVLPGLLVFTYFRVISSPLYSMLVAKGRPDINARVNLQVAPVAILSFVIGAQQGGIVGVSLAVAVVLGIGWTTYWWWVSCRILKWPLKRFLPPCFVPILLVVPGSLILFYTPLFLKPFLFLLSYVICMRIFTPKILFLHQTKISQILGSLSKMRRQ